MTESISPTWFALWMHCHLEAHPQNSAQVFISFMVEFYGILKEPLKLGTANMFFTQLTYYVSHVVQCFIFPYVIGFHPPHLFSTDNFSFAARVFIFHMYFFFYEHDVDFHTLRLVLLFSLSLYTCHLSCVKTMWSHMTWSNSGASGRCYLFSIVLVCLSRALHPQAAGARERKRGVPFPV